MDPVLRAGHDNHHYNWLQLLLEHQKSIRNRANGLSVAVEVGYMQTVSVKSM